MKMKSESEVAQSCPTLRDPMDCSLPGSSVHGVFQAIVLGGLPLPSLDLIKLKTTAKEINKMKRLPTDWEKIFANNATEKELISKIKNSSYNSIIKKKRQHNEKMGRRPNRHFSREDMQIANRHMK